MQTVTAPNGQVLMIYDSNNPSVAVPPTLINSYSILTIPAYYRAMRFLSENLARFPRQVHQNDAPTKHPLDSILGKRPNGYQNATVFWRTLFFSAAHRGNGFARIDRQAGRPVALHNLIDSDVMPFRYDAEDGMGLQQWYYWISEKQIMHGDDVLHFASLGIDGMTGLDPIRLHTDTFQRAKTIDKYVTRFLMKGTVLKGAIEIPGSMTDEQFAEFRLRLRSNFRGSEAEDDVLILTDQAKLNNATMSGADAQLIEQGHEATRQIAQITGVHPHYLYDDKDGKYNNNAEQAGIDIVKYTFGPWMELIDDELTMKLLTPAEEQLGLCVKLCAEVLKRGDSATTTNTMVAQVNAGLRTPNEARPVLNLPKSDLPAADQLERLGTTQPVPDNSGSGNAGGGAGQKNSAAPPAVTFAALTPLIDAAADRVDTKTEKAFANAQGKKGQALTIWANVFAEEQARYAAEAFAPIAAAVGQLGLPAIDAQTIGKRYADQVRKRAAGQTPKTLRLIAAELLPGCKSARTRIGVESLFSSPGPIAM